MKRKYRGIKKVVGDIKRCDAQRGLYIEVHYDIAEDQVLADLHWSLGETEQTVYHDSNVVRIGNFSSPVTMRQLKERIDSAIRWELVGDVRMATAHYYVSDGYGEDGMYCVAEPLRARTLTSAKCEASRKLRGQDAVVYIAESAGLVTDSLGMQYIDPASALAVKINGRWKQVDKTCEKE